MAVKLYFILLIMLSVTSLCQCEHQLSFCPDECDCTAFTMSCVGKGLLNIPQNIPPEVQRIDLQDNLISVLRQSDLIGLRQLKVLQLMNNKLHSIEPNALDDLRALQRLRLDRNELQSIPDGTFANTNQLHRLDLSRNALVVLTADMLNGLAQVRNLQLDQNRLTCIDERSLGAMTHLEILTINNNNLTTLENGVFNQMTQLRTLRFQANPWQCDCHLRWMSSFLQSQPQFARSVRCATPSYLREQSMESPLTAAQMKCAGSESRGNVECSRQAVCPRGCVCAQSIVDCRQRALVDVPNHMPEDTTELRLERNELSTVRTRAFEYLKQLRRLDLSNNGIEELQPNAFEGLDALTSLVLYGNKLVDLPSGAFRGLKSLQLLLLNANHLECVRYDSFVGLENLNLLSLYDNNIKSIGNGTFDSLKSLQTIHLARNPLQCDCNLKWLGEHLQASPIETSGARCVSPRRVAKRRLAQLMPHKYRCKGSEYLITRGAGECQIEPECPAECRCEGTVVDCSQSALSSIPRPLPRFITKLLLTDNQIETLHLDDLFLEMQQLREINLSGNKITAISSKFFRGAENLLTLDLSRNHLTELNTDLLAGLKNLEKLNLHDNKLQSLSNEVFNHSLALRTIDLTNNKLKCIYPGTFDHLPKLEELHLTNNDWVCDCSSKWMVNFAQSRSSILLRQPVCALPSHLINTPIKHLDLRAMNCEHDNSGVCAAAGELCPVGCTCEQGLVRCSNLNLNQWPLGIPEDTRELYLDNNQLRSIPKHLNRLNKLTKLDLSNNAINVLQDEAFSNLTELSTLIVSYNKLQCVRPKAFAGLRKLRIISLHSNDLSMLPAEAFENLQHTITHMALGANPWWCDCQVGWLAAWMQRQFLESGIARCDQPKSMSGQLLLTASPHSLRCEPNVSYPLYVRAKCDACAVQPCKNGAGCVLSQDTTKSYECQCAAGFVGEHCEGRIDACFGRPCANNASCKALPENGRFHCTCTKGFTGVRCEQNINDCVDHKCRNGARCVDQVNQYTCQCPPTFTGWDCGKPVEFCSTDFNPCANEGICVPETRGYTCSCALGFTGRNCTENVDDCLSHKCRNGAKCVDGIASYSCSCVDGYSGRLCELPPVSNALYPRTSACHQHSCVHGDCVSALETDEEWSKSSEAAQRCECHDGYAGDACDQLQSVHIGEKDSWARLDEPWPTEEQKRWNITLRVNTKSSLGVLAHYDLADAFLALELFGGRVKLACHVGNPPASNLYSYERVDDGRPHVVSLVVEGTRCTLRIDSNQARFVLNEGTRKQLVVDRERPIHLGGLPGVLARKARDSFQLGNTDSLDGCIEGAWLQGEHVDFSKTEWGESVSAGCSQSVRAVCDATNCDHGTCRANKCKCERGYSGPKCDQRTPFCIKRKKTQHYTTPDGCRTARPVKQATCEGWCGQEGCCTASRVKQRRLRLRCPHGKRRQRRELLTVIRKCSCALTCQATPAPFNRHRMMRDQATWRD